MKPISFFVYYIAVPAALGPIGMEIGLALQGDFLGWVLLIALCCSWGGYMSQQDHLWRGHS